MCNPSFNSIRRIAVIGAGPGGVAAAKYVVLFPVAYTSRRVHIA